MAEGTLHVTLHYAAGLKNTEMFGRMDPYAKLACGVQTLKSKEKTDEGSNPHWEESFQFAVNSGTQELTVTIFNANVLRHDDVLGTVRVPLAPVFGCGRLPSTAYPVFYTDGNQHGQLFLELSFTPGQQTSSLGGYVPSPYPNAPPAYLQAANAYGGGVPQPTGYPPTTANLAYQQGQPYPPAQPQPAYGTNQMQSYPPPQQSQAYPPAAQSHAYPPAMQQAYPPSMQQAYPNPPQQAYPPAAGAHFPGGPPPYPGAVYGGGYSQNPGPYGAPMAYGMPGPGYGHEGKPEKDKKDESEEYEKEKQKKHDDDEERAKAGSQASSWSSEAIPGASIVTGIGTGVVNNVANATTWVASNAIEHALFGNRY